MAATQFPRRPGNLPTLARVSELFAYDLETGVVTRRKSVQGYSAGVRCGHFVKGYLEVVVDGRRCRAHHLAWLLMTGAWPSEQIDHRNGNRSDNRWANLREATREINTQNRRSASRTSSTGLLGVCRNRRTGRFIAKIVANGTVHYLGYHDSPEAAHAVYLAAKRRLHQGSTL